MNGHVVLCFRRAETDHGDNLGLPCDGVTENVDNVVIVRLGLGGVCTDSVDVGDNGGHVVSWDGVEQLSLV